MATVGMRYHALPKEPISMADEILTVAEVAVLLKMAENTVQEVSNVSFRAFCLRRSAPGSPEPP